MKDWKKYLKKGEICWTVYNDQHNNPSYLVITKNILREKYILLDIRSGAREEVTQSVNPLTFESKIKF